MIGRAHSFARTRAWMTALAMVAAVPASADIVLASRLADGTAAGQARNPTISADGRWVAFDALDLIASDTDGKRDVYLFDAQAHAVQRMSRDPANGNTSVNGCSNQGITPSGRHVLMACGAKGLLPGVTTDYFSAILVLDRDADQNGTFDDAGGTALTLMSKEDDGTPIMVVPGDDIASISDDGRRVAYYSYLAGTLAGALRVHDRDSDADGLFDEAGAFSTSSPTTALGTHPLISGDGSQLAFETAESHAVHDTNGVNDVYRVAIGGGPLQFISVDYLGQRGTAGGRLVDLSADGDEVLFEGGGQNFALPPGYTPRSPGSPMLMLRDVTTASTVPAFNQPPDAHMGTTYVPSAAGHELDATGETALVSYGARLYLKRHDTVWPPVAVLSVPVSDAAVDGSADHVAAVTTTSLVANDLNGLDDVYVVDRAPDLRIAVAPVASTYPPTHPGTGPTFTVTLSNEGTFSAPAAMLDLTQAGMQIRQLWFPDPDGEIRGGCDPLGAMASNTLHCSALLLDPGKTWTITVETNSVAVGTATLTATVVSAPDDVDSDDHVASADVPVVPGADLEPLLGSIPGATVVGNGTSMLLGVINRGTVYTATNARMRLTLPSVIQFDSFGQVNQFSGGCTIAGNVIDCLHAALAPGESVQVQVAYTGTSVGGGTVQMVVSSDVADSDPADNATGVSLSFIPVPPPPPPPAPASGGGGASDLWSLLALLAIAGARRRRLD
jgi:hypothetical protein